jgi:exodeoxyribonuclease-3
LLVCGDTNIAIRDNDVANPENWADTVLCAPEGRKALATICDWGLTDVFAEKYPDGGVYSWWDYRNLGFPKNDGLRIDHIFATKPMVNRCSSIEIDRDERKGTKDDKPSDHVPVIAVFD